jgi:PAS domain S-box-containing protein
MAIGYGKDCHTMRANAALRAMLGVDSDRNVSKSASRASLLPFRIVRDGQEVRPDDLPMQKVAREGVALRGNRYEYYRQDGRVVVLQSDVEPWRSADGEAQGSVGIFTDITETMDELKRLRTEVSRLGPVSGLVRICSACRKVADASDTWSTLDTFLARHLQVRYTHGLCPDCFDGAMRLIELPPPGSSGAS